MTKLRQCAETVAAVLTEKLCARPGDVNPAGVADIIEQVLNATAREQEEAEHQRLGDVQANAWERLTQLLNASPAVIYSFKASGNFAPIFVSENIKRLLGYRPDEYLENADFWRTRVHPEDVDAVEAEQAKQFEAGAFGRSTVLKS
jgi:adenylate cyclase